MAAKSARNSSSTPRDSSTRFLASGEISSQAASFGRAQGGCSKVKTAETVPSTPTARVMTARWPMCTPSNIPRATARGISGISTPGNAIVFMGSHAFRGQERVRARGGMFKRASRFSARRLPASPGPGTRRLGRTPGRGWSPAASDVPDPGRRRCRSGQPGRR